MVPKTRRGQFEMLGLAVIVVFIALGMFFLTQFSLFQSKPSTVQNARTTEIASDFVNSLLNSNAGCDGTATFTTLIDDLEAPDLSPLSCGGKSGIDLVEYFNESINSLLNQTMTKWGYKYEFSVLFPQNSYLRDIVINQECSSNLQRQPASYQFRGDYGIIQVTMTICY